MNLPICSQCENEVKPGEDYCLSCLGEELEPEFEKFSDRLNTIHTFYSAKLLERLVPSLINASV